VAFRSRMLLAAAATIPIALVAACGAAPGPGSGNGADGPASVVAALPASPAPGPATISESGSTLLFPLLRTWAARYHSLNPQLTITTAETGSGAGIADASDGKVSIGASDAYLSSGDLVDNPTLLNIPLAISAQQVDYNLPSLGAGVHLSLSGEVLAQIYQGQITRWDDPAIAALNPGVPLPGTAVVPLHRADSSGDTFLFSSYLSTHDPGWNSAIGYGTTVAWPQVPGAAGMTGNSRMVSGCKATPGCVAYIGISYLSQALAAGLGEAALQNASGQYLLPTPGSISGAVTSFVSSTPANETISMVNGPAAGGYPIVNYEYAIVSTRQRSAAAARDIKAFLRWVITTGNAASYLSQVQFQPLPGPVVTLSDTQITSIG
jgi:phosphate transport system substrate-binding protein